MQVADGVELRGTRREPAGDPLRGELLTELVTEFDIEVRPVVVGLSRSHSGEVRCAEVRELRSPGIVPESRIKLAFSIS